MLKPVFKSAFQIPFQNILSKKLWTPSLLSVKNLCWLDFVDTNYITLVSGKISSMTDKSSNARVFSQATAGNRPTYGTNGATFLRTLDYLVHEGAFFSTNAGGFRIFATVINESEASGSDGVLISESNFTADSRPYFNPIIKRIDDGTLRNRIAGLYRNNTGGSFILTQTNTRSNVPSLSLTEYNLISVQDTQSVYRNFTNTVQSAETSYTRTGAITPTNRTVIGALLSSTGFGTTGGWIIKDILVTSNDLTADELDAVNGYMAWNANIQTKLPSNHPYRYSPPYV